MTNTFSQNTSTFGTFDTMAEMGESSKIFSGPTTGEKPKYVTASGLKNIIKEAHGSRYTDEQIYQSLEELGCSRNGLIEYDTFCKALSNPKPSTSKSVPTNWLSHEEWQVVLKRIGLELTLEQTRKLVEETKKQSMKDVVNEHLSLQKIGLQLTDDQVNKILRDAFSVEAEESTDYETEDEVTISES